MRLQVIQTAVLQCPFGTEPSRFMPDKAPECISSNKIMGTIMDHVALSNIQPFGLCSSLNNPEVKAATDSNKGRLTPMPCIPVTPAPWVEGSPTVLIKNLPALHNQCVLHCKWAGVIRVVDAGQGTHFLP